VPDPTLHHIGFVVASIASSAPGFTGSIGAAPLSQTFDDPIQRARVAFIDLSPGGGPSLELVEPLADDSPVAAFLAKGGGLHHLCFEVDDLDRHIETLKAERAVLIRSPKPATAFGGRRIAWMMTREKLLVEYLERARAGAYTGTASGSVESGERRDASRIVC
jgi:methylmalonyl-CoA/ethylmalonyl-CoA epimerase